MTRSTRVGFVGLGRMGVPMTRRLMAAGFPVYGFNRSRGVLDALSAEGLVACGSAAEVAERAEVVLTALPTEDDVRDVAAQLLTADVAGTLFVEHSTVGPDLNREIAALARERGADYLDAPVSGGPAGAEAGKLTVMVGGPAATLERARPVLEAFGDPIRHCGEVGAGQNVKLVNQLLVAVHTAASAEAAALSLALGADLDVVREVVGTSFGGSTMLNRNLPRIAAGDFAPATPVDLIYKDLGIIRRCAREGHVPLRLGELANGLYEDARRRGLGGSDMSALSTLWEPA